MALIMRRGLMGTPHERLVVLAEAIEWILDRQHEAATERNQRGRQSGDEHRRYQDAVLALSKAFALASASDEARDIRDEVGFFQTVRAALVKSADQCRQERCRSRVCNPADLGSGRRLDRDRRHPRCRRDDDAGHLDPL